MLNTTIKSYTTRQAAMALVAVVATLIVAGMGGRPDARPGAIPVPTSGTVHGTARVIDGDTLDVAGIRIRLEGIDAPETRQTCSRADGHPWSCGWAATRGLETLARTGEVTCASKGHDKHGRMLGVCWTSDGREINAEMVRLGLAWAFVRFSSAYVGVEAGARAAKVGVWQGTAQPAWEYRDANIGRPNQP